MSVFQTLRLIQHDKDDSFLVSPVSHLCHKCLTGRMIECTAHGHLRREVILKARPKGLEKASAILKSISGQPSTQNEESEQTSTQLVVSKIKIDESDIHESNIQAEMDRLEEPEQEKMDIVNVDMLDETIFFENPTKEFEIAQEYRNFTCDCVTNYFNETTEKIIVLGPTDLQSLWKNTNGFTDEWPDLKRQIQKNKKFHNCQSVEKIIGVVYGCKNMKATNTLLSRGPRDNKGGHFITINLSIVSSSLTVFDPNLPKGFGIHSSSFFSDHALNVCFGTIHDVLRNLQNKSIQDRRLKTTTAVLAQQQDDKQCGPLALVYTEGKFYFEFIQNQVF